MENHTNVEQFVRLNVFVSMSKTFRVSLPLSLSAARIECYLYWVLSFLQEINMINIIKCCSFVCFKFVQTILHILLVIIRINGRQFDEFLRICARWAFLLCERSFVDITDLEQYLFRFGFSLCCCFVSASYNRDGVFLFVLRLHYVLLKKLDWLISSVFFFSAFLCFSFTGFTFRIMK